MLVNFKPASVRWLWLFLVLSAAVIYTALTQRIEILAHDAAAEHVLRAVLFSDAIRDGVLYPRWTQFLHLGLGSPIFTLHPPLSYYGLDLLFRLGLPHSLGWRVLMAAGLLAAFLGAYQLVHAITGQNWPAVVAAVAYLYAPYILRDAFERGSAEAFSVFLYPWILWALLRLGQRPSPLRFVVATLLWAICIGFHVLGPLMLAPPAGLMGLILAWRYRTPLPLIALLVGILLTAFIWAPMIPEQSYIHVERDFRAADAIPANNPIPLDRLLAPPVVYDIARDNNTASDRIGLLTTFLLLLGIPGTFIAWAQSRRELALFLGAAAFSGWLLIGLFTSASDPAWRLLGPLLGWVQYRTRLMGLQALAAAVVAGMLPALLSKRRQVYASTALIALLIAQTLPSLYLDLKHRYASFGVEPTLQDIRTAEVRAQGTGLTAYGEFTPRWHESLFSEAESTTLGAVYNPATRPLVDPPSSVQVNAARIRSSTWDLDINTTTPVTLTLYLLYYPRWQATVDGQPLAVHPQPGSGYVQMDIPAGPHQIALRYGRTWAEWAGMGVSGVTLLALLILALPALWKRLRDRSPAKLVVVALPARWPAQVSTANSEVPGWWLLVGLTALLAFKIFYVDPDTTWLRCVSTPGFVCGAQAAVDVSFSGGQRLRGYEVPSYRVRRGDVARVNLFWEGDPSTQARLHSFVHIRNSQKDWPVNPHTSSDIWAQADHETPGGLLSTEFLPGRLYLDEFRVPVPADIPPGTYLLEVGWANSTTGEQLDPQAESVKPPLQVLWRSILLPSITVQ